MARTLAEIQVDIAALRVVYGSLLKNAGVAAKSTGGPGADNSITYMRLKEVREEIEALEQLELELTVGGGAVVYAQFTQPG